MERVLTRFMPVPCSKAEDGAMQKLIGRVVLAGNMPFLAPGDMRPCVWYRVNVQEQRKHTTHTKKGGTKTHYTWHTSALRLQPSFSFFTLSM